MAQKHLNLGTPNGQNGDFVRDAHVKIEDNFTELYNTTQGVVDVNADWRGGLNFAVTANAFPVSNIWYSSTPDNVVLDVADGTFDRIDLIVGNTDGTIGKVTGEITGATPAEPNYDHATQYPIKFILVQAGQTDPSGYLDKTIFNENLGDSAEWDFTPTANITVASDNAQDGTKSIEGVNTIHDKVYLSSPTPVLRDEMNTLKFWIRLKEAYGAKGEIYIYFKDTTTPDAKVPDSALKIAHGQYGFDADSTSYQEIIIDLTRIKIFVPSVSIIEIKPYKAATGTIGYYLDNITLQVGEPVRKIEETVEVPVNTSSLINDGEAGDSKYTEDKDLGATAKSNEYGDLDNKPSLGTVATSNDYADLDNKPTIGTAGATNDYADLDNLPVISTVGISNDYNDLDNLPVIGANELGIWEFDSATTATAPPTGKLKFNSAAPSSSTFIFIGDTVSAGANASFYIENLQPGDIIYVQQSNDNTKFIVAEVSATLISEIGWNRIPVTIKDSGGVIDNLAKSYFTIYKKGIEEVVLNNIQNIKQLNITGTPPVMQDLLANPLVLVPAAGADKLIKFVSITGLVDFNSVAYDFTANFDIKYVSSGISIFEGAFGDANSGVKTPFNLSPIAGPGGLLSLNEDVVLTTPVDATVGDSDIKYIIFYIEQDFNF